MIGNTVPIRIGDIELLVEAVPTAGSEQTSRADGVAGRVTDTFGRAQHAIVELATSTAGTLRQLGERAARPQSLEIEFGLRFTAQGNVVLAGASTEATLTVKLAYVADGYAAGSSA